MNTPSMASLYLHIPFCEHKCLYCDFYSIENLDPMVPFLDSLDREISLYKQYGDNTSFVTIFFGGGTPSLLTPQQLERIMVRLYDTFAIDPGVEITLETNPGTVNLEKLAAYRALGVNRLSVGIQSFRAPELKFLERIHNAAEAVACVEMGRKAGFDNVSIDLIYSLPGQTLGQWGESLQRALALEPDHVSAYSLIVEDHTPLARMVAAKRVTPNSIDVEALLYEETMHLMDRHGFEHYEVSNYAKPGRRSRHNYAYWSHQNYISFGPSAHAFWRTEGWKSAARWSNVSNLSTYVGQLASGKAPVSFREEITMQHLMNERIFLGLRSDGVDLRRWLNDFGVSVPSDMMLLARELIAGGRMLRDGDILRLTPKGFLLCDEIAERMII